MLRTGRTTTGQAKAIEALGPKYLVPYQPQPVDLAALFGRAAPTVLEIGFGMGEATAHIAGLMPEKNFLCCEVHTPGVGALLKRIGDLGLTNIRIVQHDAVEVLDMLPVASLAGVHIFFPDPWHKARHNKRRLVQPHFVAKLLPRLKWRLHPLRHGLGAVCAADAGGAVGAARAAEHRPRIRAAAGVPAADEFENRGLRLGHGVWDVVFRKK